MSTYAVCIAPAAKREIKKLTCADQSKVLRCLDGIADQPRPNGVEKLSQDPRFWRAKAGDYRVIYSIDDQERKVTILVIRHRKDAYRDIDKLDARLLAATFAPILANSPAALQSGTS